MKVINFDCKSKGKERKEISGNQREKNNCYQRKSG